MICLKPENMWQKKYYFINIIIEHSYPVQNQSEISAKNNIAPQDDDIQ